MSRPADPLRRMTVSTFLPTAILTGVAAGLGFDDVAVCEGVCPRLVREVWKRMERDGRTADAMRLRLGRQKPLSRQNAMPGLVTSRFAWSPDDWRAFVALYPGLGCGPTNTRPSTRFFHTCASSL